MLSRIPTESWPGIADLFEIKQTEAIGFFLHPLNFERTISPQYAI